MSNLFKKVAVFTDLHIGLKSNSTTHLKDCEEFIDWFILEAQKENCETGIFMGDWSHNRNNLNLITLNTSVKLLEKLGQSFEQFFWFPGNHDLFFKDKRDVHSSAFGRHIPGVTVIEDIVTRDDVTFVPWMVGDEWKTMKSLKSRYVFGHLELPLFYMNAMIQMPDHGKLKVGDFVGPEYVFSGHFHKRQQKGNVIYIGNAFPHDYADVGDDDRGMMILEWGGQPEYRAWPDAPKFRSLKLSELIDHKDTIMKSKMYIKVHLDIDISFEEANFIKETFMRDYDVREISLIQDKTNLDGTFEDNPDTKFESVDKIVAEQLVNIDSEQFDSKTLLEIYENL
jgi:DNA repair exonuclease SbcCD nuclease subunit